MSKLALYANQDPRNLPAYGIKEASRYISIPVATLRSWVRGRPYPTAAEARFFEPLIVLPDEDRPMLSFMNLVETHILDAIRKKHGISLPKVRTAIEYLSERLNSKHPLAEESLKTDNIDLFVDSLGRLINVSQAGQLGMKDLLKDRLRRIDHDAAGLASRLYPFTSSKKKNDPKLIVIDPFISFGRPVIKGSGVKTGILAERYKAGESVDDLVEDYGLEREKIEEAIRYELRLAA